MNEGLDLTLREIGTSFFMGYYGEQGSRQYDSGLPPGLKARQRKRGILGNSRLMVRMSKMREK